MYSNGKKTWTITGLLYYTFLVGQYIRKKLVFCKLLTEYLYKVSVCAPLSICKVINNHNNIITLQQTTVPHSTSSENDHTVMVLVLSLDVSFILVNVSSCVMSVLFFFQPPFFVCFPCVF